MSLGSGALSARVAYLLGLLILVTSLVDLFVGRLLFRAGPEVLSHVGFDASSLAVFSRVSFTFEQLALFVFLGISAFLMIGATGRAQRLLGLSLVPQAVSALALYFGLPMYLEWGLSLLLVLLTAAVVVGLVLWRGTTLGSPIRRESAAERLFLAGLAASFVLPTYYRLSVLLSPVGSAPLPFAIESYTAGVYAIMATAFLAFLAAITASADGFRWRMRNIVLAIGLPALVVGSILYGLLSSFFMGQIFSLVIAMSTDIVLSYTLVRAIVFFWGFLLAAFAIFTLKGLKTGDRFRVQQGIGLMLLLSTSFLFNYPAYLLLGTAGVLLLTRRLER